MQEVLFGYSSGVSLKSNKNVGNISSANGKAGGVVGFIENGTIEDCSNDGNLSGTSGNFGGICGVMSKGSSIYNSTNHGDIDFYNNSNTVAGGIVGKAESSNAEKINIEECENNGNIMGYKTSAGIVGDADKNTNISFCINTGEVDGNTNIAGIVADCDGTINKCINKASITAKAENVAGIAAVLSGSINECANFGTISTEKFGVGGVVAVIDDRNSTLSNCYNTGDIIVNNSSSSEKALAGGIVANVASNAKIKNSYNIGKLTSESTQQVGAIAGASSGTITNCYYLEESFTGGINGEDVEKSAEVKTEEDLKSITDLLNQTNTSKVWIDDLENSINFGYPIFEWQINF